MSGGTDHIGIETEHGAWHDFRRRLGDGAWLDRRFDEVDDVTAALLDLAARYRDAIEAHYVGVRDGHGLNASSVDRALWDAAGLPIGFGHVKGILDAGGSET